VYWLTTTSGPSVVTPGVRASGVVIAQLTVRTGKCVLGSVNAQGHRTDQHAGTWSAEGLHFKGGGSCSTPPPSPTPPPLPPPSAPAPAPSSCDANNFRAFGDRGEHTYIHTYNIHTYIHPSIHTYGHIHTMSYIQHEDIHTVLSYSDSYNMIIYNMII
jgi:hypothetical protein